MYITAAVLRRPFEKLRLETLELKQIQEDEILVRLVACGICHTDISCRDAVIPLELPLVLGHEGAGIVERVGPAVTNIAPGDHVLMTFASCGACLGCRDGHPSYCSQFGPLNFGGGRSDGSSALWAGGERVNSRFFGQSAFATHAATPRSSVIRVDASLPLEILAPLGCGVQTGAGAVLNVLVPAPGSSIAVFGIGTVGMSAIMAAKVAGCLRIIAVDRVTERLVASKAFGADLALNAAEDIDIAKVIREFIPGGVDHVIDTTGVAAVVDVAIRSLAKRGSAALIGMYPPGMAVPTEIRHLVLNGLKIFGVVEGDSKPDVLIPKLIELYRNGLFPIDRLITTYPFTRINDAMADAEAGRVMKAVLLF